MRASRAWPLRAVLLALCATTFACATPGLPARFLDRAQLETPSPERFPHSPAVVLFQRLHKRWTYRLRLPDIEETFYHRALMVLTQEGIAYASIRIPFDEDTVIRKFEARTISPDGSVHPVPTDAVLSTETKQDETNKRFKVFRFPQVQVGSVLEYFYLTERPSSPWHHSYNLDEAIPVMHYELELEGSKNFAYALKAYNTKTPIEVETRGGRWRLRWSKDNLPAYQRETAGLDESFERASWIFRCTQIIYAGRGYDRLRAWKDAIWFTASHLDIERDLEQGFQPKLALEICEGDVRCVVKVALGWLRERVPFSGYGRADDTRRLLEVLQAKKANNFEKANLLHVLLRQAGVKNQLGATTPYLWGRIDRTFPSSVWFRHRLLWVEPGPGAPEGFWVDPSCEWCKVGQLPQQVIGQPVLRFRGRPIVRDDLAYDAEWETIQGEPARADRIVYAIQASVDRDGTLLGRAVLGVKGFPADQRRRAARLMTPKAIRRSAEAWVTRRASSGELGSFTPVICDAGDGSCRQQIDFEARGFAVGRPDRLLVPLSLFWRPQQASYLPTDRPRRGKIGMIRSDETLTTITLRGPSGWKPTALPEAMALRAPGRTLTFEVRVEENEVILTRTVRDTRGVYPKSAAAAYDAIEQAQQSIAHASVIFRPTAP